MPDARPRHDGRHSSLFNNYPLGEHCGPRRTDVAVVICVYNEEWYSLQRSLESLAVIPNKNGEFDPTIVKYAIPLDVALVIDGVEMLKPCMREYLHQLFGAGIPVDVDSQSKASGWPNCTENGEIKPSETCVTNKETINGHLFSLILKRHNHKKINSHEWGFMAFAQMSQCKYILTSDCGTLFDPKCISNLFDYMEAHEQCVACTGRQRVMRAKQQADPYQKDKKDTLVESMLRRMQALEYEVESLGLTPAGSIFGYLHVLPGPCAFFRREGIEGPPLDKYFDIGYKPTQDLGMLQSSLKIAEDRISSWSAVWTGQQAKYSAWVDEAVYFSEAELTMMNLILQRRRWINGIFSGYVFIVRHINLLVSSHNPVWMKASSIALAILQLTSFLVSYLSVAIFGSLFYMSTEDLGWRMGFSECFPKLLMSIYFAFYVILILYHVKRWEGDQRFNETIWAVTFIFNGSLAGLTLFTVGKGIFDSYNRTNGEINLYNNNSTEYFSSITAFTSREHSGENLFDTEVGLFSLQHIAMTYIFALPFFIALLSDINSFCIIINPLNILVGILGAATYTAFFKAYAISRHADLTWGQRPTIDAQSTPSENMNKCFLCNEPRAQDNPKYCQGHIWLHDKVKQCKWASYTLVIVNVVAVAGFLHVSPVVLIALSLTSTPILQTLALLRAVRRRLVKWVCKENGFKRCNMLVNDDDEEGATLLLNQT